MKKSDSDTIEQGSAPSQPAARPRRRRGVRREDERPFDRFAKAAHGADDFTIEVVHELARMVHQLLDNLVEGGGALCDDGRFEIRWALGRIAELDPMIREAIKKAEQREREWRSSPGAPR